jgi:hypothetical protein
VDGPLRAEEDRALVHPHAVFCARVSLARLLQEEASGQSGKFSFFFSILLNVVGFRITVCFCSLRILLSAKVEALAQKRTINLFSAKRERRFLIFFLKIYTFLRINNIM